MPDITMCSNFECPLRGLCYRYRAVADPYWQSYCYFTPNYNKSSEWAVIDCDHFWDIRGHAYRLEDTKEIDERCKPRVKNIKLAQGAKNE